MCSKCLPLEVWKTGHWTHLEPIVGVNDRNLSDNVKESLQRTFTPLENSIIYDRDIWFLLMFTQSDKLATIHSQHVFPKAV